MADGIQTLAYEHINLNNVITKISYNDIPNILVNSVVLPNKPLSNLEIIDAAKKLSLCGFTEVFLRDTLPTKTKLNECGILNLDSSSVMVHIGLCGSKKVRISSISIVMECNTLAS